MVRPELLFGTNFWFRCYRNPVQAASSYAAEAQAWRSAVELEAERRAHALRPRHRQDVRQLAQLVEALSAAVEAERKIRAELGELGSSALVDAGYEFGDLSQYNSLLSAWNRRMISAGLVD